MCVVTPINLEKIDDSITLINTPKQPSTFIIYSVFANFNVVNKLGFLIRYYKSFYVLSSLYISVYLHLFINYKAANIHVYLAKMQSTAAVCAECYE